MNKFTAVAFAAAFAVSPFDASARPPNYDESKVAPYALEDPLAFADGRKLSGPEEWPARRALSQTDASFPALRNGRRVGPRYLAFSPRRCTAWSRLRPRRS